MLVVVALTYSVLDTREQWITSLWATTNREPQTTLAFTVGATEGPPLRIELR